MQWTIKLIRCYLHLYPDLWWQPTIFARGGLLVAAIQRRSELIIFIINSLSLSLSRGRKGEREKAVSRVYLSATGLSDPVVTRFSGFWHTLLARPSPTYEHLVRRQQTQLLVSNHLPYIPVASSSTTPADILASFRHRQLWFPGATCFDDFCRSIDFCIILVIVAHSHLWTDTNAHYESVAQ